MTSKITNIKQNSIPNKNSNIFTKTISNFMSKNSKYQKTDKEFRITSSTEFYDNNLTNPTIASSIRSISKLKLRKKEKPLSYNFEDFHKQFILNKNKNNYTLFDMYNKNGYRTFRTLKTNFISNFNSKKNNVINLKKKTYSPSIFSSSTAAKSRSRNRNIITNNNIYQITNDNQSYSYLSSFLENINFSKDNKNIFSDSNNNNYSKELLHKSIINNLINSPQKNKIESILKQNKIEKDNKKLKNENTNLSKLLNKKAVKNEIFKYNTNSNENKIGNIFIYMGRNKVSLNDKLAYPTFNSYIYSKSKRSENNEQFLYKTRLLALNKYIQRINKDRYNKQFDLNNNILEKEIQRQKSLEKTKNLFFDYKIALEDYLRFLHNKTREVQEEEKLLKQNKLNINNEIEKLKRRFTKEMNKMKERYNDKFFLICIKNNTSDIKQFSKKDIEELEKSKLKFKDGYYLNQIKNQNIQNVNNDKKNKLIRTNSLFKEANKKIYTHSTPSKKVKSSKILISKEKINKVKSTKSSINVNRRKSTYIPGFFFSDEEFFQHLDNIATKIYNLIKKNNDIIVDNIYLKMELNNIKKDSNEKNLINSNKKELYEKNLQELKLKNKNLTEKLNLIKDNKYKSDINILLVLENIHKIYNNINNEFDSNLQQIKKEDIINYGEQIYLKEIEKFFLVILNKVNEDKIKYPEEYKKIRQNIDKQNKINAIILSQKLFLQKFQIKIDNVLKKASKIIYKKTRVINDYRGYYKPFKKKKRFRKQKSNTELFYQFISNSD